MKQLHTILIAGLLSACAFSSNLNAAAIDTVAATTPVGQTISDKVNINTAGIEALMTLPGVGKSKAEAIVAYRTKNGDFQRVADITLVKGIGDKLLKKFSGQVSVK